jgi:catalase
VAYEPNSLAMGGPRESPQAGFTSFTEDNAGGKIRERSETFADHYSQPSLFWRSMREPEQRHIVSAFVFELSKVSTLAVRRRMLGHLMTIHRDLGTRVAAGMGMEGQADTIKPARPIVDMKPSPALSLIAKAPETLEGRKVGVLVTDGSDGAFVQTLKAAVEKAGAQLQVVAPKVGGAKLKGGATLAADHQLAGAPSVVFDAVVVAPSPEGAGALQSDASAIDWLRDAYGHLKVIGVVDAARPLLERASVEADDGVIAMQGPKDVAAFVAAARHGRVWDREPRVRPAF